VARDEARWCDHLEPVTVKLECGGQPHAVTWRRGRLVLEDHPDLAAERALVALGGSVCTCLDVLDAWAAATASFQMTPSFISAAGPSPEAFIRMMTRHREAARKVLSQVPEHHRDGVVASQVVQGRRLAATSLPGEMRSRLGLTLVVHCERNWSDLPGGTRLAVRLLVGERIRQAVVESLRHWSGLEHHDRHVLLHYVVVPPGSQPALEGRATAREAGGTARLPVSWLVHVAARHLAVVDGCVVLGLTGDRALAARWEQGADGAWRPRLARARLRYGVGGRPSLVWEG